MTIPFQEFPAVIGHRGAAGLVCENTLASLKRSADLGVQWVEVDLRLSKDNEIFIFHDDDFKRLMDREGSIEDHTAAEIHELRMVRGSESYKIPSLEEVLRFVHQHQMGINLEIKPTDSNQKAIVQKLKEELLRLRDVLPTFYITTFDETCLALVKEYLPTVPRGYLTEIPPVDWQDRLKAFDAWCLIIDHRQNSDAMITSYTQSQVPVLAYTVNDLKRAEDLWKMGLTAVFTDFPDRLI
ncbi:MAG: hypothetical protein KBE16_07050 [Alphaproteobacteria bacterium]|nr:hypothetical protein [Alphaproteobacteria bacterium]MBP9877754.1 hypothetical protein [Alphaproteobacteria bacterium]